MNINKQTIQHEIRMINTRLAQLRKDWKDAKPGRKKLIELVAKLHKDKLSKLETQLETATMM